MNAKLRIVLALSLGVLAIAGTLLAMGTPSAGSTPPPRPFVTLAALEPYMVKDIFSGATGSSPSVLTAVSGKLFFAADDGTHGKELWKSDGTSDGTFLVKDIYTGTGTSSINNLADVSGTLFLNADDGAYGLELWKSDGTANGTVMVKDIRAGSWGSQNPSTAWLARVGNTLFFVALEPTHGEELWTSDGTSNGTILVKDIYPGGIPFNNSTPDWLTEMNGLLFFTADDGSHGRELWKSDGTLTDTVMVSDITPGGAESILGYLTVASNTLFFGRDNPPGHGLWKSDGTLTGTVVVSGGLVIRSLKNVNGTLFFLTEDTTHLWKSDGTLTGTVVITDFDQGGLSNLTEANGTLFFRADDGAHGRELWKSDGTPTGTIMVKDINPIGSSTPSQLRDVYGTLFFQADDGSHGIELWKSDGTLTGTVMVADVNPGNGSSSPYTLRPSGATLFFVANDGSHGTELWALPMAGYRVFLPVAIKN